MKNRIKHITSVLKRDELIREIVQSEDVQFVFDAFCDDDPKVASRAAWVFQQLSDEKPKLLKGFENDFIVFLPKAKTDAQKRFIMRYFMRAPLPEDEELQSILLEYGFKFLNSPQEAIAHRANAMTVLERLTELYPDLLPELISVIENTMPFASTGLQNRAKHTLRRVRGRKL